jgi:hypothetical protein
MTCGSVHPSGIAVEVNATLPFVIPSEAEGPAVRLSPTQLRNCVFSGTQGSLTIGILDEAFPSFASQRKYPAQEFLFPDIHTLLNAPACPLTGSDAGKGSPFMRASAAGDGSLRQISQF